MKSIDVQYYALLREEAGKDSENFRTSAGTFREFYEELRVLRAFSLPVEMIQVAVNDEFTGMDTVLPENARVVFIPPVAGG